MYMYVHKMSESMYVSQYMLMYKAQMRMYTKGRQRAADMIID